MARTDKPLLKLENVTVSFPVKKDFPFQQRRFVKAVTDVSLEIYPGETFGVVGESGCGKSTLANTTLGMQAVDSGKIYFGDEELTAMNKKQLKEVRRHMQMIFQDPFSSLNPRFSVFDIISEPLRIKGGYTREEMREEAAAMLREVGLSEADLDRYPSDFSGGQKQRIGIARALILKPEYLVCDEPVSALDVSVHAQILNLLMDLQAKYHITYLFISHNLSVVHHISDRVGVMYLGRLVELAPKKLLFKSPQHPYTKMLLDAIPDMKMTGKPRIPIKGEVPNPLNPPTGCAFHPRCPIACERCKKEKPQLRDIVIEGETVRVACHAVGD